MGACNCVTEKQEKSVEIGTDLVKPIEKLDKSTQSESIVLPNIESTPKVTAEVKPKPSISLPDLTPNPSSPLTQLQSLFRGYLSRKAYRVFSELKPEPIAEVPLSISTFEAKQAYSRLAPFKFDKPAGDEAVSWKGPTKLFDGSVYVGEWNTNGFPHGKGIMYYIDGGICEGFWANGKLDGKGRRVSPKGDVYNGSWNNGVMEGQGRMEYTTKNVYEGGWANNKQHGFGIETWPDGSKFEGFYENGLKCGKGKFCWPDNTKYDGEFFNDLIEGFGKYSWVNREYEGYWKESKMHGKGIFKWSDGKMYQGDYVMDVKEGFGIFVWPDGRRYEGFWKNGKQHGEGMLINKSKKRKGLWENGKFLQKIKNNE